MPKTRIDYDTDSLKHYVRLNGWLPAMQAQLASLPDGRPLRYFTFCAAEAIDVFLFLREQILHRDPDSDCVIDTFYCERYADAFARIATLIGAHEQGFLGEFEEIVLFQDDDETIGRGSLDSAERFTEGLRSKLRIKERHLRFRSAFPFDALNLDVTGNMFPPAYGVSSRTLQAIRRVFDWQQQVGADGRTVESFTLFLTTHVERGLARGDVIDELVRMVDSNRETSVEFSDAYVERFGGESAHVVAAADFDSFYAMAVPKMIVGEAFDRGWIGHMQFSGLFGRTRENEDGSPAGTYQMLHWVGRFERTPRLPLGRAMAPGEIDYRASIARLVAEEPRGLAAQLSDVEGIIAADLEDVVQSRETHARAVLTGPP